MPDARGRSPHALPLAADARPGGANGDRPASVYLYPGDWLASADALVVSTVLGSCVAVCLWDHETRSGGLNHFVLPYASREDGAPCRFGPSAMELLLEKVLALGCERRNLTARMFGGASQFAPSSERVPIGAQNVAVATRFLEEAGIPLVESQVGGTRGRRVVFSIATGDVAVKNL
jgi:chemotaxis protein CheD